MQWRACLRDYAYPRLGETAVDRVTTADVMAVLLPLWTQKHETAPRLRRRHCQVNESGTYEGGLIRDQAAVTAVHTVNARARNIR